MDIHEKNPVTYIFRAYRTLPNGVRIYARRYGKKAFRFAVPTEQK